ncbi:hypothetical protein [Cupriavidus sp. UYPR2.512]|uniref:hypothetical protein n=1 Tax=Cupriavidus sp. UYPR2.512 TaxID=1080187 RepID=UPI0003718285|nr:hypothetical protein KAF44_21330 [Cupriavidus necator]
MLEVTGKGNQNQLVPVTGELIAELTRYRGAHATDPAARGKTRLLLLPVIASQNGDKGLSRWGLHLIRK